MCLSGERCAQGPRACGRGAIVGGAVRRCCFPDEIFSARISVPGGCGGSFFPALTRGKLNPCVFAFGVAGGWRRDGHPPALILVPILSFARYGSCVSTVFRRSRRSRFSKFPGHFSSLVSPFPGRALVWFGAHGGEVISLFSLEPGRGCPVRARTTLRRHRVELLPGRTSVPSGCTLPFYCSWAFRRFSECRHPLAVFAAAGCRLRP